MKTAHLAIENGDCGYSAEPKTYLKQKLAEARQTLLNWRHRARTRRELSALSLRMLEDAGIEPHEAKREAAKPFWRG